MAGILAVLGLTAAFVWGVAGTITALDRVDDFDRVAIPGSIARYDVDPGRLGRAVARFDATTTGPVPEPPGDGDATRHTVSDRPASAPACRTP